VGRSGSEVREFTSGQVTVPPPPRYRAVEAVSLVLGPALMSIGDLFHPAETWDMAVQIAIVAQSPLRWFAAHLLLFVGLLLFIPGILALTRLVAMRRPATGYCAPSTARFGWCAVGRLWVRDVARPLSV
jgi:hypothetical protein